MPRAALAIAMLLAVTGVHAAWAEPAGHAAQMPCHEAPAPSGLDAPIAPMACCACTPALPGPGVGAVAARAALPNPGIPAVPRLAPGVQAGPEPPPPRAVRIAPTPT